LLLSLRSVAAALPLLLQLMVMIQAAVLLSSGVAQNDKAI